MPLRHRRCPRHPRLHDRGETGDGDSAPAWPDLMQRSVVIVGAGPAGMAAAIEAVGRGCRVTVIDEAARPGGQIYRQSDPALTGREFAEPTEQRRKHKLL